jgi:hypothetical protein
MHVDPHPMFCGLPLKIQRHSMYTALVILGIALLVGSAVVPPVYAPTIIVFDAAFSTSCTWPSNPCGKTLTWSHTVGSGSNRILVVGVEITTYDYPPPDVLSISYGANSLTLYVSSPTSNALAWMYVLSDPPVGTSTVTVTFDGAPEENAAGGSLSYFNVGGVGSYSQNQGLGSPASETVDSAWGNGIVVDLLRALSDATPISQASGQTLRWQQPTIGAMSDKITTTPTTTMTWTLAGGYQADWEMVGIGLIPAHSLAPVGGFVEPVNKLSIIAPYVTLFALIAVVAAVTVIPWKKP